MTMLQNHPGDVEFPVRPRMRWGPIVRARSRGIALRGAGVGAIGVAVFFGSVIGSAYWTMYGPRADVLLVGVVAFAVPVGVVVGLWSILGMRDRRVPRREQQAYRELVGTPPLTRDQQIALALDAASDWSLGAWNSSLDYLPSRALMTGAARAPRRFILLTPLDPEPIRIRIDRDHRIVTAEDLVLWATSALDLGVATLRFREALTLDRDPVPRLVSLTGRDERALRSAAESEDVDGLFRGADAHIVVSVARECYLAGISDHSLTWELVDHAAELAYRSHTDWDDHWGSVRLGRALLTDDLGALLDFDGALAAVRSSAWPAASIMRSASPFRGVARGGSAAYRTGWPLST